ncbi:MAG: histidinol-phosphate transaminase [Reichenbachiella sp.]|uniref:histidinol-phosphate transaminase n=1 Tax=Reichenbachiella sp. TaxID=2184521 RepID=UPI003263639D
MDITKLIRTNVLNLTPYSSARDEFDHEAEVYLDANENPFDNGHNRYPDPYQKDLKMRIAELKGVSTDKILLGNGSDEVLDLIFRVCCEPSIDNIVSHNPSYGMYPVLAAINNVAIRKVNLDMGFQLNADKMINTSDERTKIFFLCSPNNPSGNLLNKAEVKKILNLQRGLVVIDEAYIDFSSSESWLSELDNYPNLVVCQTLSKAWGLAGLRVGMCFASAKLIKVLNAIKPPYNVNQLSQRAALNALNNETGFKRNLSIILDEREKVEDSLRNFSCVTQIYPSEANFLLIKVDDADKLYRFLMDRQIVVRNRSKEYLCNGCLRLTIGTPEENKKLLAGIEAFEKDKKE